jgi:protocatechuate 3,4-dioxygenase beta subunit
MVGLRGNDMTSAYEPFTRAITDADGNYHIANIAAGNYQITIAAPAYVAADKADRKVVVLAEDENVENINFSLVRGGVITGKVTEGEGRPVILHQVEIYDLAVLGRYDPQQRPYPTMTVSTDDRGVYRIFGIPPGRYKVAAGRGYEGYGTFSPSHVSYRHVYHPDVTDPAKALVIEVIEGSEAKDIDIALGQPVQGFSVRGRAINTDTGAPVPNIHFGLRRILGPQQMEYANSIVVTNARGEFVIEGLTPGKYGTSLFSNESGELRADTLTFDVIDQDVTGVTLKLSKGAVISGVVVLESEDNVARRLLAETLMRAYVQTAPGFGTGASSSIGAGGSFRFGGLPTGSVNIMISGTVSPYPPKGLAISRIERDGIVTPRIEVKDGEQVTGVRVFIAYGSAVLRGVVSVENGPLPAGVRVSLQISKPGEKVSYMRPPQVDERGHFLLEGIPPGQYELTAQIFGPEVPAAKIIKQQVSLTHGAVTDVTITIDPAWIRNHQ